MKTKNHPGRQVAKLREVIRKSQSQFAAMLGVSRDTIISVENGRNRLSSNLARRIHIATGANLLKEIHPRIQRPGEDYFEDDFKQWRSVYYPGNNQTTQHQFDRMKFWIELVFKAATKSGLAGNRDRLPAVHFSLVEWLEKTRKDFLLADEIDAILEEETRYLGLEEIPIWQLKTVKNKFDESNIKSLSARLGIGFSEFSKELKKHQDTDELVIEDEFKRDWVDMFDLWEPLEEQKHFKTRCTSRKLTKKPKYWFQKRDAVENSIS